MGVDEWVICIKYELQCIKPSSARTTTEEDDDDDDTGSAPCIIYRVPASLKELHKGAYEPHMVSLGPYHHGDGKLKPMEKHKHRALLHFLQKAKNGPKDIATAMNGVLHQLKNSYEGLDEHQPDKDDRFLEMMIEDGCFVLEVLRVYNAETGRIGYGRKDPVFSEHGKLYVMPHLRKDMLMLENQLPMLALTTLAQAAGSTVLQEGLTLIEQIRRFCDVTRTSPNREDSRGGSKKERSSVHILDEYLKCRTHQGNYVQTKVDVMWSATELNEGGIRFRRSKSDSFKDVSFEEGNYLGSGGILRLPRIDVDDSTEAVLLNLMALEQLTVGAGNAVTSYACLMDTLIDTPRDVELLRKKQIVQGWVGSDENVAALFNRIPKDTAVEMLHNNKDDASQVNNKLFRYRNNRVHRWRAGFVHTYLRNPWVFISLLGALILLSITLLQDVYTVLPYYANKSHAAPPPFSPSS